MFNMCINRNHLLAAKGNNLKFIDDQSPTDIPTIKQIKSVGGFSYRVNRSTLKRTESYKPTMQNQSKNRRSCNLPPCCANKK